MINRPFFELDHQFYIQTYSGINYDFLSNRSLKDLKGYSIHELFQPIILGELLRLLTSVQVNQTTQRSDMFKFHSLDNAYALIFTVSIKENKGVLDTYWIEIDELCFPQNDIQYSDRETILQHQLAKTEEELVRTTEELQASNEELIVSNEELTTINEELSVINNEFYNQNQYISVLLNNAVKAFVLVDAKLKMLAMNDMAKDVMLRFFKQDLSVGDSFEKIFKAHGHISRAVSSLKDGSPVGAEYHLDIDGQFTILDVNYSPIMDGEDNLKFFVFSVLDKTEERQKELQLLKAKEDLELREQALEEAQRVGKVGSWEYNLITGERYLSEHLLRMFKVPKSKENTASWTQFLTSVHPEDRAKLQSGFMRLKNEFMPFNIDLRIYTRNGRKCYVNSVAKPVRGANNKVVKLAGTLTDITERIQYEKTLEENWRWFESVVNATKDGLITLYDKKVSYFNKAILHLFGYTAEDKLKGKDILDFFAPKEVDKVRFYRDMRIRYPEKVPSTYESIGVRKDGSTFPVELTVSVSNIQHKDYSIINFRDISSHKYIEDKLRDQNKELIKANAELDKFVYSTAHDLKSPVSSMLGLVYLAKMEPANVVKELYISMMEENILRLEQLLKNIADYSQNNRQLVKKDKVNFHRLLHELQQEMRVIEGAELITFELNVLQQGDFITDRKRVNNILSHLLNNAVKYRNTHSDKPKVTININANSDGAIIKIVDNGIGIHTNHLQDIFQMFFRATEQVAGSGLGLYIVKETVTALDGEVVVESELNVGSMFTVRIPNLLLKRSVEDILV